MTSPIKFAVCLLLTVIGLSAGCKKESGGSAASAGSTKIRIQLDWKPEPQFGGFYAAEAIGAFKKHGLDVEIISGAVGAPTAPMVANGTVEFGITSADNVILGRQNGMDIVGLFASYQTSPQGIMTHAERNFAEIGDVFRNDGTVAMQSGLPYALYLKKKYGFDKVKVVPSPGGDLGPFRADPKYSMQCFVTSEPLAAKKAGVPVKSFLISDTGYNPYTTIVIGNAQWIKKNPDVTKKLIAAVREGWEAYLADPKPANDLMRKLRPDMDDQTFAESAKAQEDLVRTEETKANGLGTMSKARWETLIQQLTEVGVLKSPPPADQCFMDVGKLP